MTSTEWLYTLSKQRELDKFDLEQAQAMHKEEILAAFTEGASDGFYGESDSNRERYYSETFKKK